MPSRRGAKAHDRATIAGQPPYHERCFTCGVGPWWESHNAFDEHAVEEQHPAHVPREAV